MTEFVHIAHSNPSTFCFTTMQEIEDFMITMMALQQWIAPKQ
jgi:hypothetical protein